MNNPNITQSETRLKTGVGLSKVVEGVVLDAAFNCHDFDLFVRSSLPFKSHSK